MVTNTDIRKWNATPNGTSYMRDGWRVELVDPKGYRWCVRTPDAPIKSLTFESALAAIQYANALIAKDDRSHQ